MAHPPDCALITKEYRIMGMMCLGHGCELGTRDASQEPLTALQTD